MNNYSLDRAFKKILNKYDCSNPKIKLKIQHMKRVSFISEKIAESLELDEEMVHLAKVIGMLHDIGRFMQIELYNTFEDSKSIDHALASNKLLFEEGYIKYFYPKEEHYEIIKKAIYNHNKLYIEDGLSSIEIMFCRIIRDADKIDIYRSMAEADFSDVFTQTENMFEITKEVEDAFFEKKLIHNELRKTTIDNLIVKLAHVYDLHYKESKKMLTVYKYLDLFLASFVQKSGLTDENIKNHIEKLLNYAKLYIAES